MSRPPSLSFVFCAVLCAFILIGCAGHSGHKGTRSGSKPYTVRGKTYYPLASAKGFTEEGLASWYGPGFHGKKTASGEKYNQSAMTAAHKLLPLGTKVRVTHLGNGRSIIVRVNDRGPFVEDRVIDLSRAAAARLNLLRAGTGRVRVNSLDVDGDAAAVPSSAEPHRPSFYIQLGAFADKGNANRLVSLLTQGGHKGRLCYGSNGMWNVQVGPWKNIEHARENLDAFRMLYAHAFVVRED
ncbi:MAG: septal ring lytic transglycosylase RlpA family protein [Desulfovibrio sp.]|nr:septal ring lytic transglycosylase RlpA family protein [Desulfovibrio sp.]